MYTKEDLQDRVIWLFREPRTGSNWLLKNLLIKLDRKQLFFDEQVGFVGSNKDKEYFNSFFKTRKQETGDTNKILHTHHFLALESLNNYKNPIVLRTARKNKTDLFISRFIAPNVTNIYNINSQKEYDDFPKIKPLEFPIDLIDRYIKDVALMDEYWKKYSAKYDHETFYYEDLLEGYQSKILPVNLSMKDKENNLMFKLPYDKREVIKNYDLIDKIIKEYYKI